MFVNIYLDIAIIFTHISYRDCYVNYEIFHGFDIGTETIQKDEKHSTIKDHVTEVISSIELTTSMNVSNNTASPSLPPSTTAIPPSISTAISLTSIPYPKFLCPEDERPFNIGAYEVPTQRDVALQIQITLRKMFHAYQQKAMGLLHDIKEVTKATSDVEKKCYSSFQNLYKKCVAQVRKKCEFTTKNILSSLERQRADVSAFIEGTICTVTEMKADPLQLLKVLAMEQASLEFALPGFLRLLGRCSTLCKRRQPKKNVSKKPARHMTDQDLVVKHFLTKKSYIELIKDSN